MGIDTKNLLKEGANGGWAKTIVISILTVVMSAFVGYGTASFSQGEQHEKIANLQEEVKANRQESIRNSDKFESLANRVIETSARIDERLKNIENIVGGGNSLNKEQLELIKQILKAQQNK